MLGKVLSKLVKIEILSSYQRGHPGTAFTSGNRNPVHHHIKHAGARSDNIGYLCSRYIFALPPKRVTDTINKIKISLLVPSHKIACPDPCVPGRKDVSDNFFV